MEYTRIRSFQKKFFRVSVSEEDLVRLAKKIAGVIDSQDDKIRIRIETADKKEVFSCNDPDFFRSDDMPAEIAAVSIAYPHYDSIMCKLSFVTGTFGSVELSVEGVAPEVPALFQDLEKVLDAKKIFGHALVNRAEKARFRLTFSVLGAAFVFLVFDVWLDLWKNLDPNFGGSNAHMAVGGVGWTAILMTIASEAFWAETVTKKLLMPVQFTGRISDPATKSRRRRFWVITVVLFPLVIGVIASAIYEALGWWLAMNSG